MDVSSIDIAALQRRRNAAEQKYLDVRKITYQIEEIRNSVIDIRKNLAIKIADMPLATQIAHLRQALIDLETQKEKFTANYAALTTEQENVSTLIAHLDSDYNNLPSNEYDARHQIDMLKMKLKDIEDLANYSLSWQARDTNFFDCMYKWSKRDIEDGINDKLRIQKYLPRLAANRATLRAGGAITAPLICTYIGEGDTTALSVEQARILREKYGYIVVPLQELRECYLPKDITAILNRYIKQTYPDASAGQVKISKIKIKGHGGKESDSIEVYRHKDDATITVFTLFNCKMSNIFAHIVNSELVANNPEIVLLFCKALDSNKYSSETSAAPADPNLLLEENCMVRQIIDGMLKIGLDKRVRIKAHYDNGVGIYNDLLILDAATPYSIASNIRQSTNAAKFVTQLYYQDNQWQYTTYSMAEYRRLKHSNQLPLGEIAPETISTLDPVAMPALESAHITSESTITMPLFLAVTDDQNANDDCHNPLESLAYGAIAGFVAYSIAEAVTLGAFDYQLSVSILAHSLGSANIIGTGILPFLCISLATAAAIGITYSFVDYISQPPPIACHNR